jgi:hypothetical protein
MINSNIRFLLVLMLKVEVLMPGSTFNKVKRLAPGIGNATHE